MPHALSHDSYFYDSIYIRLSITRDQNFAYQLFWKFSYKNLKRKDVTPVCIISLEYISKQSLKKNLHYYERICSHPSEILKNKLILELY